MRIVNVLSFSQTVGKKKDQTISTWPVRLTGGLEVYEGPNCFNKVIHSRFVMWQSS